MEEVLTSWGKLPRWKARCMALGEIQAVMNDAETQVRADSAKVARQRADVAQLDTAPPEDKPPPLAADAAAATAARIDAEHLAAIQTAIDSIEQRLDALEAYRRNQVALETLEDAIEATYPPTSSDGVTLN
jgi:hypothetical protein